MNKLFVALSAALLCFGLSGCAEQSPICPQCGQETTDYSIEKQGVCRNCFMSQQVSSEISSTEDNLSCPKCGGEMTAEEKQKYTKCAECFAKETSVSDDVASSTQESIQNAQDKSDERARKGQTCPECDERMTDSDKFIWGMCYECAEKNFKTLECPNCGAMASDEYINNPNIGICETCYTSTSEFVEKYREEQEAYEGYQDRKHNRLHFKVLEQ